MMKKKIYCIIGVIFLIGICVLTAFFCSNTKKENKAKTKATTQGIIMKKDNLQSKGQMCEYNENSDGTWSANGRIYKRKIALTGKLPNSEKTTTYIVLTNDTEITFAEVAKSFYSSDSADLLNPEKTCVVQCFVMDSQNTK